MCDHVLLCVMMSVVMFDNMLLRLTMCFYVILYYACKYA
jgi:hypothetical protein